MDCGAIRVSRRPASREYFICAITATRRIFPNGRWPPTARRYIERRLNEAYRLAPVAIAATPAGIAAASIGIVTALESEARTLGSTTRHADRLLRLRNGMLLTVSGIGRDAAGGAGRAAAAGRANPAVRRGA